jgi:TPR repeat protein
MGSAVTHFKIIAILIVALVFLSACSARPPEALPAAGEIRDEFLAWQYRGEEFPHLSSVEYLMSLTPAQREPDDNYFIAVALQKFPDRADWPREMEGRVEHEMWLRQAIDQRSPLALTSFARVAVSTGADRDDIMRIIGPVLDSGSPAVALLLFDLMADHGINLLSVREVEERLEAVSEVAPKAYWRRGKIAIRSREIKRAEELYRQGISSGDTDSAFHLADAILLDRIPVEDKREAIDLLRWSSKGSSLAQERLALFYSDGLPGLVEEDKKLALDFALMVVDSAPEHFRYHDAGVRIAHALLYGEVDDVAHLEDGLRLARALVEARCPDAYLLLGKLHLMGYGVERDVDQAIELLRGGAQRGSIESRVLLEYMQEQKFLTQ